MRRLLSFALIFTYTVLSSVSPLLFAQAAEGDPGADPFELIVPATARVNEAFDVTVKAKKPDGTINTTYT